MAAACPPPVPLSRRTSKVTGYQRKQGAAAHLCLIDYPPAREEEKLGAERAAGAVHLPFLTFFSQTGWQVQEQKMGSKEPGREQRQQGQEGEEGAGAKGNRGTRLMHTNAYVYPQNWGGRGGENCGPSPGVSLVWARPRMDRRGHFTILN